MARKGLLDSVLGDQPDNNQNNSRADYAMRGASRSMKLSIDDLAENAKLMAEGEAIVSIDTKLIDGSFVKDRMTGDDESFEALKQSIAENGQETPALLRPHPDKAGRYMVVFGHRRVRAAEALGIEVRAIVKSLEDVAHVIAQGQENTARENLSFIEKALFAKKLLDMHQSKETIMSALTVDATLLSRMLSVASKIPLHVIEAVGAAKSVGRDRWEELKKLIIVPANQARAEAVVSSADFQEADSERRFDLLLSDLQRNVGTRRKGASKSTKPFKSVWEAGEGRIKITHGRAGKAYTLSLTSADGSAFADYLTSNLDRLYAAFEAEKTGGDK